MSSGRSSAGPHDVRVLPLARREVSEATLWYLDQSPQAAERFVREFEDALRAIGENPELWPRAGRTLRQYLMPSFPYLAIYRIYSDRIEVVAVAHASRRPGYWRDRL